VVVWLLAVGNAAQDAPPRVVVAEYDGIIHPIATEFVEDLVARAQTTRAASAVLILRTPGGLLDSTRAIVQRTLDSPVPVVVFVAPPGSRAASAGFLITIAADVAAMAPGTHIGAAHPVTADGQGGGGREDEGGNVMMQKAPNVRRSRRNRRSSTWWRATSPTCCGSSTGARSVAPTGAW
jgi:membrane-bound ClpP family serine protease